MANNDPVAQNILGVQSLVGSKTNKSPMSVDGNAEGISGDKEDALTLKLSDDELLKLARLLEDNYAGYEGKIKIRQEANLTYYLGKQKEGSPESTDGMPIAANLLFEAEETFLPAALSKNPEPVVYADDTAEGTAEAKNTKTMLQYHADILVLRRKLTLMTRKWSIDFLSVIKHGWDPEIEDITSEVRDVKKFIFDIDGYVDVYGDFVGNLGERISVTASRLIELFPEHEAYITVMVAGKLGTRVTYTEWWSDEFTFTTFKDKVLSKNKNDRFNYETVTTESDLDGNPIESVQKARNHFGRPKKPYTFLSVFSLGDTPHDITGLIEQNIPNQRRVSRRTEQIDYNLSKSNNADVFSQNNFNQETAKQAKTALAKGNPVLVPSGGRIQDAIVRLEAPQIGASFFNELENSKNDLRQIFGTQGITALPAKETEDTARGQILQQSHDTSRIGGGIGDALEQVADNIFNWWVQLYSVYYDEPHFASILGHMRAVEHITLSRSDMKKRLVVSVSPDSLKPKDEITEMNQALALWNAKALDPKTLLTMLNMPDPQRTAEQTVLWLTNPQAYVQMNFPNLAEDLQSLQQPLGSPPQAQGAPAGGVPQQTPDENTLSAPPANASLSQVPL